MFVKKVSKSKTKLEGKLEGVRTIATRHAACVGRRGRAHEFVCVEGRRGHARVRVSSVSRRGRGLRWSEGGELQSGSTSAGERSRGGAACGIGRLVRES